MNSSHNEITPAIERLRLWCNHHHLNWNENAPAQFETYFRLLIHYQKQTNLTGFNNVNDLVDQLCMDSLQILRLGPIPPPMLDVGSGAGFPAIPIKILQPELEMILVEPRSKRYAFLRRVEDELHLSKLTILHSKIESAHLPQHIGMAISKAFMPILDWVNLTTPWARQGTQIACLVSKQDWLNAQKQLENQGFITTGIIDENNRIYAILSL